LPEKVGQLPQYHTTQLNPNSSKANTFKNANRATVLSEVHLYVNKATTIEYPGLKIAISDIKQDGYLSRYFKSNPEF
jgi:hypothetical protein